MSQPTETQAASGLTSAAPPRWSLPWLGAVVLRWLQKDLFLRTESGPVGWRKILLAVIAVVAASAISLSRTVGAGSLNTIWIEDAKFLLNQALNNSFWVALRAPISSYYQEPARILTEIAIQFPLSWAPGVMAIFAAAQYAMYGLVAYIASGPYLRSPWLRLLISAPVCAIPLAYTQVNNDLVTVQFFGLYGAFWTVLWIPGTRAGKIISPLVMATVSWTAVLSLIFAPLIVARLIVDRSKNAWALAILWASGAWIQISETVLGTSTHPHYGSNGLFFVLQNYVARVVPRALFGERSLGGPGTDYTGNNATPLHITSVAGHDALIAAAWVIVLVVVALAVARFTDPNWTLACVAALFSVGIFFEELFINTSVVQPRYIVAPALLLYIALVALMRPRLVARPMGLVARPMAKTAIVSGAEPADISRGDDPPYPPRTAKTAAVPGTQTADTSRGDDPPYPPRTAKTAAVPGAQTADASPRGGGRAAVRWLPAAGFAVLLLVAVTLNFRVTNGRTTSPAWTSVVATASKDCAMPGVSAYTYVHEWWSVTIPCSRVR